MYFFLFMHQSWDERNMPQLTRGKWTTIKSFPHWASKQFHCNPSISVLCAQIEFLCFSPFSSFFSLRLHSTARLVCCSTHETQRELKSQIVCVSSSRRRTKQHNNKNAQKSNFLVLHNCLKILRPDRNNCLSSTSLFSSFTESKHTQKLF